MTAVPGRAQLSRLHRAALRMGRMAGHARKISTRPCHNEQAEPPVTSGLRRAEGGLSGTGGKVLTIMYSKQRRIASAHYSLRRMRGTCNLELALGPAEARLHGYSMYVNCGEAHDVTVEKAEGIFTWLNVDLCLEKALLWRLSVYPRQGGNRVLAQTFPCEDVKDGLSSQGWH